MIGKIVFVWKCDWFLLEYLTFWVWFVAKLIQFAKLSINLGDSCAVLLYNTTTMLLQINYSFKSI